MVEQNKNLPLRGINVLVTRTLEQSAGLVDNLRSKGAEVTVIPAVAISPLPDPEGLARAMARINTYDNVVFTSVNGVANTLALLSKEGLMPQDLPPALCVGDKTAGVWVEAGGTVEFVPRHFTAHALLYALGSDLDSRSFLIMRPEVVKTDLGKALRERGASVDEIVIYRTIPPEEGAYALKELLAAGKPQSVFFASPSAVEGLVGMVAKSGKPKRSKKGSAVGQEHSILDIPAVCIGPTTARAAEEAGFSEVYFPDVHTAEGMVEELLVIVGDLKKRM